MFHFSAPPKTKTAMLERLAQEDIAPVQSKLAGRNTLDYMTSDGRRVIRLHETDILTFHDNGGITIYTGGFNTVTTRSRLNEFLPRGKGYVSTHKGQIRYSMGYGTKETPFRETLYIGPRGAVKPDKAPASLDKDRKRIDAFMKHVKANGLPQDSAGDPWVFDKVVCPETAWDWIDSNYMTQRLYVLALEFTGLQPMGVHFHLQSALAKGLDKTDLRRIRRYLRACVGMES